MGGGCRQTAQTLNENIFGGLYMSGLPSPMMLCRSGDEHGEQVALMQWVRWHWSCCKDLELLFAIPNGGSRDKITASRLKAEGVKPGVSDLFLPVPRHGKFGLWIEMKKLDGGSGESKEQIEWGERMRAQGFAYCCCHGWQAAAKALMLWLELQERPWQDGSLQSLIER